jgi:hypothetical protein
MLYRLKRYFWNIAIAFDQFVNTLFAGDPDETISSRLGKIRKGSKFADKVCQFLHLVEKEHCEISIEKDEGKDQVFQSKFPLNK